MFQQAIVAFNSIRLFFRSSMLVGWQHLCVSFPVVSVVVFTRDTIYLFIELLAGLLASATQLES